MNLKIASKTMFLSTVASMILVGCGSGGGDSSSPQDTSISGRAIDGYLSNAKVCLDLDLNGICENGKEPFSMTNEKGYFTLKITSAQRKHLNFDKVPLVVYGGIDTDTNKPFKGKLQASDDGEKEINVTPLTTLVSKAVESATKGKTVSKVQLKEEIKKAEKKVKKVLKIPEEVNISDDPIVSESKELKKASLGLQKSIETFAKAKKVKNADKKKDKIEEVNAVDEVFEAFAKGMEDISDDVSQSDAGLDNFIEKVATNEESKKLLGKEAVKVKKTAKKIARKVEVAVDNTPDDTANEDVLEDIATIIDQDLQKIEEKIGKTDLSAETTTFDDSVVEEVQAGDFKGNLKETRIKIIEDELRLLNIDENKFTDIVKKLGDNFKAKDLYTKYEEYKDDEVLKPIYEAIKKEKEQWKEETKAQEDEEKEKIKEQEAKEKEKIAKQKALALAKEKFLKSISGKEIIADKDVFQYFADGKFKAYRSETNKIYEGTWELDKENYKKVILTVGNEKVYHLFSDDAKAGITITYDDGGDDSITKVSTIQTDLKTKIKVEKPDGNDDLVKADGYWKFSEKWLNGKTFYTVYEDDGTWVLNNISFTMKEVVITENGSKETLDYFITDEGYLKTTYSDGTDYDKLISKNDSELVTITSFNDKNSFDVNDTKAKSYWYYKESDAQVKVTELNKNSNSQDSTETLKEKFLKSISGKEIEDDENDIFQYFEDGNFKAFSKEDNEVYEGKWELDKENYKKVILIIKNIKVYHLFSDNAKAGTTITYDDGGDDSITKVSPIQTDLSTLVKKEKPKPNLNLTLKKVNLKTPTKTNQNIPGKWVQKFKGTSPENKVVFEDGKYKLTAVSVNGEKKAESKVQYTTPNDDTHTVGYQSTLKLISVGDEKDAQQIARHKISFEAIKDSKRTELNILVSVSKKRVYAYAYMEEGDKEFEFLSSEERELISEDNLLDKEFTISTWISKDKKLHIDVNGYPKEFDMSSWDLKGYTVKSQAKEFDARVRIQKHKHANTVKAEVSNILGIKGEFVYIPKKTDDVKNAPAIAMNLPFEFSDLETWTDWDNGKQRKVYNTWTSSFKADMSYEGKAEKLENGTWIEKNDNNDKVLVNGKWVDENAEIFTKNPDNSLSTHGGKLSLIKQKDIGGAYKVGELDDKEVTMKNGSIEYTFRFENLKDTYWLWTKDQEKDYSSNDREPFTSFESFIEKRCGNGYFMDKKNDHSVGLTFADSVNADGTNTCNKNAKNGSLAEVTRTSNGTTTKENAGTWEIKTVDGQDIMIIKPNNPKDYDDGDYKTFVLYDHDDDSSTPKVLTRGELEPKGSVEVWKSYNETAIESIKDAVIELANLREEFQNSIIGKEIIAGKDIFQYFADGTFKGYGEKRNKVFSGRWVFDESNSKMVVLSFGTSKVYQIFSDVAKEGTVIAYKKEGEPSDTITEVLDSISTDLSTLVKDDSSSNPNVVENMVNSNASALISPNGGEKWLYGTQETIRWYNTQITGNTVNLYVLQDNPTGLFDQNDAQIGNKINSKHWYNFAKDVSNTGSYTIDPSSLNGEGNAYVILVVSSEDNSKFDISDAMFVLSKQNNTDNSSSEDNNTPTPTEYFKFTTDFLNGKTLYNVFEECDEYKDGKCVKNPRWEIVVSSFTNTTMEGYPLNNPSEKLESDYTINDKGYIESYMEFDENDKGWQNIKGIEKTADYISLIWTNRDDSRLDSNIADKEYFYFDLAKAQTRVKEENEKLGK